VGDSEVGEILKILRPPGRALHRAQLRKRADPDRHAGDLGVDRLA